MKTRESGMPNEEMWGTFFKPENILELLGIKSTNGNIADLACGYGTFTVPAAKLTNGTVWAIDIDPIMIEVTQKKVTESGLENIRVIQRDFVSSGTGLPDSSCEYVFLFNILHAEKPLEILTKTKRILNQGGKVEVIHWNYDPTTPRGPSMSIRPRPDQIQQWLNNAGFKLEADKVDLPPYHYGLVGIKI